MSKRGLIQEESGAPSHNAGGAPSFSARLHARISALDSRVCVGIDPDLHRFPQALLAEYGLADGTGRLMPRLDLEKTGACLAAFSRLVIEAVAGHAAAVKPQSAYFERFGCYGIAALEETVACAAARGLPVIMDGKRSDIFSTARQYACAYLGCDESTILSPLLCDALTVNPYLGSDGVLPFVRACEKWQKGLFILVKTSNPSSGELQDLRLASGGTLAQQVARLISVWGESTMDPATCYSSVGAVLGATYPEDIRAMRLLMPRAIFLIPGYGTQGADGSGLAAAFDQDGLGALVSASRSILYSYAPDDDDFAAKIAASARAMKEDINRHGGWRSACSWNGDAGSCDG